MNLKTLLSAYPAAETVAVTGKEITGLSYDSRKARKGHLFFALPGLHHHGLDFLAQVEKAGVAAILSDRRPEGSSLPYIIADNPRAAMAHISAEFFGHPSRKLKLFGITGTNGKTTSSYLLKSVLETAGVRTGLLGTVHYTGKSFDTPASLTTPESLDLQQMLASMVEDGCGACVMEVSSHSLMQHRVTGTIFEAAIFTNLTQDHLDYHKTMENYYAAKKMLFDGSICEARMAVINKDDPYGRRLLDERKIKGGPSVNYGFGRGCHFKIRRWTTGISGSELLIRRQNRDTRVKTSLLAKYNAYNVAGVYAAALITGVQREDALKGIADMPHVPGRLERFPYEGDFLVFIDYAHTEDAMRQLLFTLREYTDERLIVLFGCGGDRDRGKRPLMGKAAGELADEVILTSDNPRHEDPATIIEQVKAGVEESGNTNVHVLVDRKDAINRAVQIAKAGDLIVLAGKGHENYQIIGDEKLHFDEREILREILG